MASPTAVPFPFPGDRLFGRNTATAGGPAIQSALGFSVVKVTLTSAQILALQTTAVTLVAAPGALSWYVPVLAIINFQGGSVAYTDAGGAVSISVGSWSSNITNNNVFTGTASLRNHASYELTGIATAAATPTNENAAITISKTTNNFAAGNGTASIVLYFNVHDSI